MKQPLAQVEAKMNKLLLSITIFLTGCSTTVPVVMKFPDAPPILKEKCGELIKLNDDAKLSDVATVVVQNYTLHHECSTKVDGWIEWHKKQKELFESLK